MPRWTNWSGTVSANPAIIVSPRSLAELADVVRSSVAAGRGVRVAGSGHSYSRLVETDGTLISLDNYQGIEDLDVQAREVTVLGGTKLRRIGPLLRTAGLAMANLGDTDAQSIAGAASTSTHGSGITLGSISTQVVGLTLVTASGEVIECSRERDADVFRAAAVSLGMLGVIARVRLRAMPDYRVKRVKANRPLDEVLDGIEASISENRHFEFWYHPYSRKVSTRGFNITEDRPNVPGWKRFLDNVVSDTAGLWLFSKIGSLSPALCPPVGRLQAALNGEGTAVDESYRLLATPRYVKLTEMEYAVPAAAGPSCLREVIEFIENTRVQVTFPIQYRYVAADDLFLSPFYERPSALIDVQQFRGMPYEGYFRGAEAIFRKHDGRPHWGKVHYRSEPELKAMYPGWDDFQRVRRQLDPNGVFMTPYLRTLFGG